LLLETGIKYTCQILVVNFHNIFVNSLYLKLMPNFLRCSDDAVSMK